MTAKSETVAAKEQYATDAISLRMLAHWFDGQDDAKGYTGKREVQDDLRRIADSLERLTPIKPRGKRRGKK